MNSHVPDYHYLHQIISLKDKMYSSGRKNQKREFNPFNIRENHTDNKYHIKFERMDARIRTKPFWWFILALVFVIILYWYLNVRF